MKSGHVQIMRPDPPKGSRWLHPQAAKAREEPDMSALNRILLVEDNEEDMELTMAALEDLKLANEVVVTRDGVEALDYLHRRGAHVGRAGENPVVVLLDLKMPRVDGLQVLREIKAHESLKTTPVVMLT